MSPFGPLRRTGPTDRFLLRMSVLCALLLMVTGALALAYIGERHANQASHVAHEANAVAVQATEAVAGSCQWYRDVAALPIAPGASKPLLILIADARGAYETARCDRTKGKLPTPDKRIVPYLQGEQRREGKRP